MNHMCEISPRAYSGGKAGSHLHPGQHMYLPISGNWLEVCNDRARRCNKPKPTPSPTNLPQNHLVGGTIIHRGPSLTQMLEAYGWSITQRTQLHTYANSTYIRSEGYTSNIPHASGPSASLRHSTTSKSDFVHLLAF